MTVDKPDSKQWWKELIIYQIYPRSFRDTNGDGVGDLKGIIEKLDYVKSLGVNAVWLNPICKSPNDDNGYDVSDYRDIMDEFGTMEDFDRMIAGMHERGIKFIMDVVVNHSSDEHQWFQESRKSRDNPYRDYYHWWPAEKGKPNYRWSFFDERSDAWKYDEQTDAYYLHYFSRKQPDLNWENPKVRQEVFDIMKFWAAKGVDGFRLDAFQMVSKDTTFPPLPEGFDKDIPTVMKYYGMGPNLHPYLREMYDEVLSQYDIFAVSEGVGSTFEDAHSLVDEDRKELQMAYHFDVVDIGLEPGGYELAEFKKMFSDWEESFSANGWLSIYLGNHDVPRMVSKYGNDSPEFRVPSAKMLNTFLLTMRGTPYCYYGDELGMTNIDFDRIEQYRDIWAINSYKKALAEGKDMKQFMEQQNWISRDNGRTPMQWDATENAGFTTGTPWLSVNGNHTEINVAAADEDPDSILNHFRKLTKLRRDNLLLVYGDYELLVPEHPDIYAYTRSMDGKQMLVLLSFTAGPSSIELQQTSSVSQILVNNYKTLDIQGHVILLEPYQAVILSLN